MIAVEHPHIDAHVQEPIQALLDDLTTSGLETGVQVAAYLDGRLVIDAWSGTANPATGEPVRNDTLFMTFSCSKGVTATVIHQLVEAGQLEYDTPVAHYWPEFAAKGKETITVRHVLTHEAGVPQTPTGITPEKLGDWDWTIHAVENLKPLWKPGTKNAYHGFTYGVILGELAQRVTGRSFAQIVQDNICRPLGISDLFFGLPAELDSRVAVIGGKRAPFAYLPSFFLVKKVMPKAIEGGPAWNSTAIRRGVIPAGNMITTARTLARHYAALVGDGVDGVRLLTPERVKIASALQTDAPDAVFFGGRNRKGLGYWLGGDPQEAFGARQTVFGHTGAGGLIGCADPEYNFSYALLKNRTTWRNEDTDWKVARAVRKALGIPD